MHNFCSFFKTYPLEMLQNFKECDILDQCLYEVEQNSKMALGMSQALGLYSRSISSCQLYCFENSEIIYEYALKFLMRNDFPYVNELNQFIGIASAAGLIGKWHSHIQMKIQQPRHKSSYSHIKLESFYGVYVTWMGTQLAVILLFVVEKFVYTKATSSNPRKIWIFLEMVIEPGRHFLLEQKELRKKNQITK